MKLGVRCHVKHKGLVRRCEVRAIRFNGKLQFRDLDTHEIFSAEKSDIYRKQMSYRTSATVEPLLRWIDSESGAEIERLARQNGLPISLVIREFGLQDAISAVR